MASFEDQVQKAVDARDIPGIILLASDVNGTPSHSFQNLSNQPN
jgi:hypothetical protein